jgi:RHS repeat-associated protein
VVPCSWRATGVVAPVGVKVTVDVVGWFRSAVGFPSGEFTPVVPTRLTEQQLAGGSTIQVPVRGLAGVPAAGVSAVAVNLSALSPGQVGKLTAWASTDSKPTLWNVSFQAGVSYTNLAIVKVGSDGKIKLATTGDTTVAVDVVGWFGVAYGEGSQFVASSGSRLVDTTTASGVCTPGCARLGAGEGFEVQVTGQAGIPAAGVSVVAVSVTALNPAGSGTLTVWPAGQPQPGVPNVVFSAGRSVTDTVLVAVDESGRVSVAVAGAASDVVIDVSGWYVPTLTTWRYTYDGDGLRRTKTGPLGTTSFVWSQAEGLAMLLTETAGQHSTYYLYGPGGLPVEQINPDGSVWWYHHDQLGSTISVTDTAHGRVAEYTYDPYGRPTTVVAPPPDGRVAFGYAGQYTDPETGYQYLRARYYDPTTGQFLTRDPANALTRSAYGYVGGNPLNAADPSGLYCLTGVKGHRDDGSEICNGTSEIADNVGRALDDHDFNGVSVGVGVCPVFGCVAVSIDWTDTHGFGFNFDGGVGVAVAYPGWNVGPVSGHSEGWSESNRIFGSAPFPGASGAWVFDEELCDGHFEWGGVSSEYGPETEAGEVIGVSRSSGYGWGGGYVHNWHWGS